MTKIEKRTEEILESLSPKEYVLYEIAQALTFDSETERLASSEHNDQRLIETRTMRSAFISKINKRYLPVVAEVKIHDALFEESLLRRLWGECNLHVDDVTRELRPRVNLLGAANAYTTGA